MKQLGLGRAEAISSRYGNLIDDNGIDCAAWPSRTTASRTSIPDVWRPALARESCNRIDILPARPERLMTRADVFVPCAQRYYVLTPDIVHTLANDTFAQTASNARFIVWSRIGLGT
ncbi:hypothetical protein E4U46_002283 [Claviceps purpurea]|nr:hypothetical protein E4U28_002389 [Claviceps purpurea]KAG6296472.1 hypothetical protein E4U46_002283 [Claviceps purpurea]